MASNTKRLRVLVVHNSYGKLSGEEVVVTELCRSLELAGAEVFERIIPASKTPKGFIAKALSLLSGIYNIAELVRTLRTIKRYNIDVVHVHNLYPWLSFSVVDAAKLLGVPVVMTVHNYRMLCPSATLFYMGKPYMAGLSGAWQTVRDNVQGDYFKSIGYYLRFLQFKACRYQQRIDAFLFLSRFQRALFAEHSPITSGQSHVIYNPLILDAAVQNMAVPVTPPGLVGDAGLLRVLFVGRVVEEKGAHLVLAAAKVMQASMPHVRFLFAGGFDADDPTIGAAPSSCEFLGLMPRDKLFALMAEVDVVLNPSLWDEPFGMSFLEAAYFGRVVITSNKGALKELSEGLYAVQAIEPECDALVAALHKAFQCESHARLDKVALEARREAIAEHFLSSAWASKQVALYKALLSRR